MTKKKKEFDAKKIVEGLNEPKTEEVDPVDSESIEATNTTDIKTEKEEESPKPNIIKAKDLGAGLKQSPGTGQHKYSKGLGYNP